MYSLHIELFYFLLSLCSLNSIDVKYQMWKLGVVFTDNVSSFPCLQAEALKQNICFSYKLWKNFKRQVWKPVLCYAKSLCQ